MSPRAQGVAMLGLVGIAAVILYMHHATAAGFTRPATKGAVPQQPAPIVGQAPFNVFPLSPIDGGDQQSLGECSWCGDVR